MTTNLTAIQSKTPSRMHIDLFAALPDVMGVFQVAETLGVSEATVRREIRSGGLRSFHAGTRVLITKRALIEYVGEGTELHG